MLVTVNDENISADNHRWKSDYGVGTLEISPNNDTFKPGLFRLAFIPQEPAAAEENQEEEQKDNQRDPNQPVVLAIKLTLKPEPMMLKINDLNAPH